MNFVKPNKILGNHASQRGCGLHRRSFLKAASVSIATWGASQSQIATAEDEFDSKRGRGNSIAASLISSRSSASVEAKKIDNHPRWNTTSTHSPFVLYSTLDLPKMESLANKLEGYQKEVEEILELSFSLDEIKIVVLRDRVEYDSYLEEHFPRLPKRRALFVQHRGPGLVLTYQHDDWTVDARHECAHAMLHSCRTKLPSWLDEGLAEYFETALPDRLAHREHAQGVLAQIRYGQVPAIEELEQWNVDEALESKQYRDAWSVVAFVLHHSTESRAAFQQYLQDLQSGAAAGYLGRRLSRELRQEWRKEFLRFFQRRGV
ncbi:MAG: DUF1570 domain-containing protein [Pirellula sp.]|nr:DUF1570 domain-containing protein [Pirellula sp.]